MQTVRVVMTEKELIKYQHKTVQLKDIRCPSLLFRFSKKSSNKGTFHCLVTDKGVTTSKVIGPHSLMTVTEARQAASKIKIDLLAEKYVLCGGKRFDNLNALLYWYLGYRQLQVNVKAATLRNIAFQIVSLLVPYIGTWGFNNIRSGNLAEQWLQVLQSKFALSTLRGAFQCLKAAFNQADRLGYLEVNPIAKLNFSDLNSQKVKPKSSRISRLQLTTLQDIITTLPMPQKTLCLICLGFLTRNQETILAKWMDIDFSRGYWHIPAEHTKTGQEISHPITPKMAELLRSYRRWQRQTIGRTEYLFPRKKLYKPISASTACHQLKHANKGEFTLHDLRKYGSTYLRDMGVDYYIVERILNHRKTHLDATYIHTSSQKIIRQVMEEWHTLYLCKLDIGNIELK
jgi:integrase